MLYFSGRLVCCYGNWWRGELSHTRMLTTGTSAITYRVESVWHSRYIVRILCMYTLQWRHNYHGGVSNHQPRGCLLNRLFRRRSKQASKLRVTGLCAGNSPGPVNSPHKGPVTRKMFPFDDDIMIIREGKDIENNTVESRYNTMHDKMVLLPV